MINLTSRKMRALGGRRLTGQGIGSASSIMKRENESLGKTMQICVKPSQGTWEQHTKTSMEAKARARGGMVEHTAKAKVEKARVGEAARIGGMATGRPGMTAL